MDSKQANAQIATLQGGRNQRVVVGLHLSGANVAKTALVALIESNEKLSIHSVYEKIGSSGTIFSDERLINIFSTFPTLNTVMVDCPVSEPPCVACTRAICPGIMMCEDLEVGMMTAMQHKKALTRKGAHKLRPINPQQQRLWDVLQSDRGGRIHLEPTYSANMAPLVIRAKTLQRRLQAYSTDVPLRETNIPLLLEVLGRHFDVSDWPLTYRNFERGVSVRTAILKRILTLESVRALSISEKQLVSLARSVETFHAFMASFMALWYIKEKGIKEPALTPLVGGWVDLVDIGLLEADENLRRTKT
jgi:hypothetical protein